MGSKPVPNLKKFARAGYHKPGQKVRAESFGLGEVFDVVDAIHAAGQAAVAAVGVEGFVEITDGNVGVGLAKKESRSKQ